MSGSIESLIEKERRIIRVKSSSKTIWGETIGRTNCAKV
jgi:hypothetical protein